MLITNGAGSNIGSDVLGHQKRLPMKSRFLLAPGWHAIDEECPHCKTSERTALGMKRWPGGPLLGSASCGCAFLTMVSIPHLTSATILEGGMILTRVELMLGGSNCLERVSGFLFFQGSYTFLPTNFHDFSMTFP